MGRRTEPLRVQPLWMRVDQNRVKLTVFVIMFVLGSAVLITGALVAMPAVLIGAFGAHVTKWWTSDVAAVGATWVTLIGFGSLILAGALIAAVQISNAEDWVRNRFPGAGARPVPPGLSAAVTEMSIAAGLPERPRLLLLKGDAPSVNAFAIGTSRNRPLIGVTHGFLDRLNVDEQRAVIATLTARIATGDIWFGTVLAALMGPLKAIRDARLEKKSLQAAAEGCGGCGDLGGCGDGCSGCGDLGDLDLGEGCLAGIGVAAFLALVALLTYAAVRAAAWIVTVWGRVLNRTAYEKADAEGMLLLKDPVAMLSALRKVSESTTQVGTGDASYDGIFYAATSGTKRVERIECRRFARLREVVATEGIAAEPLRESSDTE